jgi:hypothetical protein
MGQPADGAHGNAKPTRRPPRASSPAPSDGGSYVSGVGGGVPSIHSKLYELHRQRMARIEQQLEAAALHDGSQYLLLAAALESPEALVRACEEAGAPKLTIAMLEQYEPRPRFRLRLDAEELDAMIAAARKRCAERGVWELAGIDLFAKTLTVANPNLPLPI